MSVTPRACDSVERGEVQHALAGVAEVAIERAVRVVRDDGEIAPIGTISVHQRADMRGD